MQVRDSFHIEVVGILDTYYSIVHTIAMILASKEMLLY